MLLKEVVEHLEKKKGNKKSRFVWSHANFDGREDEETACTFDEA